MTTTKTTLLIAATAALTAFSSWKLTARGAYESAEYTVVDRDGPFEVRQYPDLTVVTTATPFERQGRDGSFMRLFRYISGANASGQKVAMTTPVFMQPGASAEAGQMAFVLPREIAAAGAPEPVGEGVALQRRTGGRFAVLRFAGRMDQAAFEQAEKKLREWMANRGLIAAAKAESAGYDPPWTPGPLRRNEVLIRIQPSASQ